MVGLHLVNFCIDHSFLFPLVQKYKNRPRNAGVIRENKVTLFMAHGGGLMVLILNLQEIRSVYASTTAVAPDQSG